MDVQVAHSLAVLVCNYPFSAGADADGELSESAIEVLNQRLADARRGDTSSDALATEAAAADLETARGNSSEDPVNRSSAQDQRQQHGGEQEAASSSAFTQSTDDDFADSLNRRIGEVAGSLASDDEEDRGVLTGQWGRILMGLTSSPMQYA
mgnify:CR=1 FL=1